MSAPPLGYSGLLEIRGTLALAQFWPAGESDGDTTHITLDGSGSVRFRRGKHDPFNVTQALDGAHVKGTGTKVAIRNGTVTVRWQGIDAPELHYRPVFPGRLTPEARAEYNSANGNFRQHYGEGATTALLEFLNSAGRDPVPCTVRTAVDAPGDVFDTYGRLIGDIYTDIGAKSVNLNHWMVENGWAFPTYYDSMSVEEITSLQKLAAAAKEHNRGIWRYADQNAATDFDSHLVFRPHGVPLADEGNVDMPKIFRRFSAYSVASKAAIISTTFQGYLKAHPDSCHKTADFLASGKEAAQRRLDEFVDARGRLKFWPQDLVFEEKPSELLDSNGEPIRTF